MDLLSNRSFKLNRQWRRRKYRLQDSAVESRKNIKIVRFGGKPKRVWKIRKLRLKFVSPLKLWRKFKNVCGKMMLILSGKAGALPAGNVIGGKQIPEARRIALPYNKSDSDEKRLIYEVSKSLVASLELNRPHRPTRPLAFSFYYAS